MILFNFEEVICSEYLKKRYFKDKYVLNRQVVAAINKLYWQDFRILYVTFSWPDKKINQLEGELDAEGCNYSGVIKVKDIDGLYSFLKKNGGHYYDRDKEKVKALYPFGVEWKDYITQVWNKG